MKKIVAALMFLGAFPSVASAQAYYGQGGYPGGYGSNVGYRQQVAGPHTNSTYYAPPAAVKKKPREFSQFSIGADYVVGFASYETVDFTIDSALTDGASFVSDTRDFDKTINSLSINLGWRPLRNIGIEAFYSTSLNEKKIAYTESYSHYPEFARGEYEVSYKVMGIDLLGFVPINDYIEFIAAIGVGKYDAEAKVKVVAYEDTSYNNIKSTSQTFEDSALAYRLGGGLQVWLSKHLTFRAMARWTQIGGDFINYITEVNAGVRYYF